MEKDDRGGLVTDTLALLAIVDSVAARFEAESTTASVVFGKREPAKQINKGIGGRVCFVPWPKGKAGKFSSPRAPGRNPRPLATLLEACAVYVQGWDAGPTNANDERAQYAACRLLFDATVRAIYLAAPGTVEFLEAEELGEAVERHFGRELRFDFTVQAMIPDVELDTPAGSGTARVGYVEEFPDGDYTDAVDITPP